MNLYSLKSSIHYHPDYIHIIWCPIDPQQDITWNEICNKDHNSDNDWQKYVNDIKQMPNVRIVYKDICKFLDVSNEMSEIHKSDLCRYKLLHKYGGIWSDLDIVYIKSITDIIHFNFDTVNFLCKAEAYFYVPIGLLLSKRHSNFFNDICNSAINNYNKNRYQCMGSELFVNKFFNLKGIHNGIDIKKYATIIVDDNNKIISYKLGHYNFEYSDNGRLKYILHNHTNENNILLDETVYMNYNWSKIDELFIENNEKKDLQNTVGFHWFNGSDITKKYISEIIEYNIPNKFNGILFTEKYKFSDTIHNIKYFSFNNIGKWAYFYINKLNTVLNIFNEQKKQITKIRIDNYEKHSGLELCINESIIHNNETELIIFDELSYAYFLIYFAVGSKQTKKMIIDFIKKSRYICFFCELFENDNLQTIGNKICNIEFASLFFKNAKQVYLCNTRNINYLLKNNVYGNITYFPPLGYSTINNIYPIIQDTPINNNRNNNTNKKTNKNNRKQYDILFYGNVLDEFSYRNKFINILNELGETKKYNISIKDDLFDDEKNTMIVNTKIVIHIPSHSKLHSFPWAKCAELMAKKVFFIIEENEEMYIQGLDKIVAFYKRDDTSDFVSQIEYYLNNEKERTFTVEQCFNYIKNKYNMDDLF